MDRVSKIAIGLIALALSTVASADGIWDQWEFKPYVGVDANLRNVSFEPSFGHKHFRDHYPDTNFFIGTNMHKYLGLEVGYEHMYRQTKTQFYNDTQSVLGFTGNLGLGNQLYISEASLDGWHLDLIGIWPVLPATEITGILGVSWVKMKFETAFVQNQLVPGFPANRPAYWDTDSRAMLRLGLGVRHMITENLGTRLQWVWENTSQLEATIPVGIDSNGAILPTVMPNNYTVYPKNSHVFGLGFFLQMA
jgi:hypothetical protein